MSVLTITFPLRQVAASPVVARLVVQPGELYRLPAVGERVCVVSGQAWLSVSGRDTVLGPAQQTRLAPGSDVALVSALGQTPLLLEVLN